MKNDQRPNWRSKTAFWAFLGCLSEFIWVKLAHFAFLQLVYLQMPFFKFAFVHLVFVLLAFVHLVFVLLAFVLLAFVVLTVAKSFFDLSISLLSFLHLFCPCSIFAFGLSSHLQSNTNLLLLKLIRCPWRQKFTSWNSHSSYYRQLSSMTTHSEKFLLNFRAALWSSIY